MSALTNKQTNCTEIVYMSGSNIKLTMDCLKGALALKLTKGNAATEKSTRNECEVSIEVEK